MISLIQGVKDCEKMFPWNPSKIFHGMVTPWRTELRKGNPSAVAAYKARSAAGGAAQVPWNSAERKRKAWREALREARWWTHQKMNCRLNIF
jgi:hypothetical protein